MAEPVTPDVTEAGPTQGGATAAPNRDAVRDRSLVATLMRLQWLLYRRSFKGNTGQWVGLIVGTLYIIGGLNFLVGLVIVPSAIGEVEGLRIVILAAGAAVLLLWTVLPLLSFGMDDLLSPRRFAALGRSPRELLVPVFAAACVSPWVLFTAIALLILAAGQMIWFALSLAGAAPPPGPGGAATIASLVTGLVAAPIMAILAIALSVLVARTLWAWRSTRSVSKRRREALQAGGLVLILGAVYGGSLAVQASGSLMDTAIRAGRAALGILTWAPWGAPFAVPFDLASGAWLAALARIVIVLVTIWALWRWWGHSFGLAQQSALQGARSSGPEKVSPLVPRGFPANALGAVAGKSLRYWRRDTRYSVGLLILPLLGLFFLASSLLIDGAGMMGYIGIAVTAWMAGITLSNEIGFDGPSSWVNITAGIDNRANLAGRFLAFGAILIPWLVILATAVPLLDGRPELIAVTVPSAVGFVLSTWGVAMVTSALLPYKAPPPGSMKSSTGGDAIISSLTAMVGTWIPMIPAIILIVLGLTVVPGLQYVGSAVALIVGVLTVWLGLRFAAKRLDRTYPDVLQKVKEFTA